MADEHAPPASRQAPDGPIDTSASREAVGPENGAIEDKTTEEYEQSPQSRSSATAVDPETKVLKQSRIKKIWASLDLDLGTFLMMFKGSLPPTIAIAIFQADSVADIYSTLGYLTAIISVLAMCIMPRAKFLQTVILNTIGICIGSAVSLLGIWSAIKARDHTASGSVGYNSSQAAVCAIWLFANIYFVTRYLRGRWPLHTI